MMTKKLNKPVGDWISAPSQNFVVMAIRVGPTTFCMIPLNRPSRKPPSRPKHLRSICHTSRLIGYFVQILGSKFLALGPKSKIEEKQFCRFCHGELTAKKWLDSIEKQKRRNNVCDKQTDGQTDRQSQRQKNNRLRG